MERFAYEEAMRAEFYNRTGKVIPVVKYFSRDQERYPPLSVPAEISGENRTGVPPFFQINQLVFSETERPYDEFARSFVDILYETDNWKLCCESDDENIKVFVNVEYVQWFGKPVDRIYLDEEEERAERTFYNVILYVCVTDNPKIIEYLNDFLWEPSE